ncbi:MULTISPECIES: NB-ARC domain-containing protein [unclassified Anabaena]|uniref:WD40 domain-containing protein n=1 Tax=unclassified Anabaena TaxID=2619674 RepID=UPI0039C65B7C
MKQTKQKRKRGLILTPEGLQKLQSAKLSTELNENYGTRFTLEDLSDRIGINTATVSKVLSREEGVDKRTIELFFQAFNIQLDKSYYTNSDQSQHQDWGEANNISAFYGRTAEIATLEKLLLQERCQLVAILGMGGIGKSTLAIKLAERIKDNFEYIIWRSLREAPPVEAILTSLIQFLSDEQETEAFLPQSLGDKISRLIDYLRQHRCLLILDNVESILRGGSRAGLYRAGYEGYGDLLKRVGEVTHQSCLLLTSREKPKEVAILEGEALCVRSFVIGGLQAVDGQEILKVKGIFASVLESTKLVELCGGNALALKMVATTIQNVFDGSITEFLQQKTIVFGDIYELLEQQFLRLSNLEKDIIYWLAINREPVSISEIRQDIISPISTKKLLDSLESLLRRSLIENNEVSFTLQPVVMEYVTQRLIEQVCEEIATQNIDLFRCHALMKATSKDYIRDIQVRLIVQPVIDGLIGIFRSQRKLENQLTQILGNIRETSPLEQSYTAGNILNLLCHLDTDLTGYDFSYLTIWQADLKNIKLHDVNFQNANFDRSVFTETFGGISSVTFSPDGKLLATGDTNGEIRLYQVVDWKQLLICKGHTNWVPSLAFSPDGNILASSSSDHTVKLWDVITGQCLQTLQEHEHEVWSVAFSPDGNLLASGSNDCTIKLWNVSTGKCVKTFKGHTSWIVSAIFSLDGQMLVSGSDDDTIRLWEISTGECLKILRGHHDGIRSISISPDNQTIVSSSDDHTVKLWNLGSGECIKTLQGHRAAVWSVAMSPQGNLIASGSLDQTVRLWDVNIGQCLKILQGHYGWVLSVAFNFPLNLLATSSDDQTVKIWDVITGQCLKTFSGYTSQSWSVNYSPDGQMLASGGHDRIVKLWDVNTGQTLQALQGHLAVVRSVAFSPNGQTLASSSDDCTVRMWDVNTSQALQTLQGHHAAIQSIAFSPDGQTLASGSEDQTIKLWDVNTGQTLQTLQGHHAAIQSIAFSPDGQTLASGAWDQSVKLWDVMTCECKETLEGHKNWIWSIAFSPNGKLLASASYDGTVRLWCVGTGSCIQTFQVYANGIVKTVVFSLDGKILASSSPDYTIKLWDVDTGECKKTLHGHSAWVWSITFNPDNQTLASSSADETIRFWDISTGKCLKTLKSTKFYEGMKIKGVRGLTAATLTTLKWLGAITEEK